ncbi:MAG: YtxH domain-containing protein [Bacteroidetes bacterium]|nr:YtxH domain-containing protein [Bacteroidota bacterium]
MKDSTGKVIAGFLIGAAVGAVAGILLAPDKGSVTRKKIADKASETGEAVKDTISEKFDDLKEYVASKFDKVKNKMDEFEETVRDTETATTEGEQVS